MLPGTESSEVKLTPFKERSNKNSASFVEVSVQTRLIWNGPLTAAIRFVGAFGAALGITATNAIIPGGLVSVTGWMNVPLSARFASPPESVPVYLING